MTIESARARAEKAAGRRLTEAEFDDVLAYTRHKAKVNGHGEDYVPLLLYDEIRNHFFRKSINSISHEFMAIMAEMNQGRMVGNV